MSEKQDRIAPRTATDLERKYNFGKTFADMLGLIDDSREKVDSVESSLQNEIKEQSSTISRTVAEIVASVEQKTNDLSSKVEMKLNAEGLKVEIDEYLANGVDRVVTSAGYEFGVDGLNISKEGELMSNTLDHTGMYVKRGDDEILVANSDGVNATNLHAKTYLIIGEGDGRCRFEDYGINRVGCFWLGE